MIDSTYNARGKTPEDDRERQGDDVSHSAGEVQEQEYIARKSTNERADVQRDLPELPVSEVPARSSRFSGLGLRANCAHSPFGILDANTGIVNPLR